MADRVYSVGQLSRSIRKNLLANNPALRDVWIEGEISGWKPYPSGHFYFTLKDAEASVSCVLFGFCVKGCEESFRAVMAEGAARVNGLKVQLSGELDVNLTRGQYSFKAYRIRLSGLGDRMAQFNALKDKLEREGLNKLDRPELRRPLPFLPHRIGIVTSPAGAVIHDLCTVLTRRFPNVEIRLFPVKVQGEGAAADVARGIEYFNAQAAGAADGWRPDLVIVGRGGGSVEDLWCFNEEAAVYAVAGSAVPVISAVGHESDTTLCDYVADLRAGTPSIAAERAVPVKAELLARVNDLAARLARAPMRRVENRTQQLDYLTLKLARLPHDAVQAVAGRLERARVRLVPALKGALAGAETRLVRNAARLAPPVQRRYAEAERRVATVSAKLGLLDPHNTLARGYSLTLDAAGHAVTSVARIKPGDRLVTHVADGRFGVTVDAAAR